MDGTRIKFDSEKNSITIRDEAKTHHYFFSSFIVLQLFSNGLQVYANWEKQDYIFFFIFSFIFLSFIGFSIFYFSYNSYQKNITIAEIKYYNEKPFMWFKFRFFKLQNNKIRLINFKPKSKAPEDLLTHLEKYQISIKS
jgi:hypothetical protein